MEKINDKFPGPDIVEKLNELHDHAMEMTDLAISQKIRGSTEESKDTFLKAFLLEREAAELLIDFKGAEPSRSILYRSAASLAIDCEKIEDALHLIEIALTGIPPDEIRAELLELKDQIHIQSDKKRVIRKQGNEVAILEVWKYIKEHPNVHECSPDKLSIRFNISLYRLKLEFKRKYDISLSAFVLQQCMLRAQQLLLSGDASIKDIAEQSGFKNLSNFVRAFRKYEITSGKELKSSLDRNRNKE